MADEPIVDFGTYLRQARERRGVSLQQVAATTKISARVLDALEHNDPRKLPGGIFSRAFVRSYAREVGLDPETVVAEFVAAFPEQGSVEATTSVSASDDPEIFESHRRATTRFLQLLGVSLVVVIIVAIYLTFRPAAPKPVSAAPGMQQADPSGRPSAPPETTAQGAAVSPASPIGDPSAGTGAGDVVPVSGAVPAAAAQAPPAAGAPATSGFVVGLSTTARCWLSVTVDGDRVLSRTLDAGEQLTYNARQTITLIAGNAGGLSVTLDGKPAKPIGSSGQVVTTTITLETLPSFLQQP